MYTHNDRIDRCSVRCILDLLSIQHDDNDNQETQKKNSRD